MGLSYTVSPQQNLVRITATGDVGVADSSRLSTELLADSKIGAGTRILVEATHVESHLSFSDLQKSADGLSDLRDKGVTRLAIVTDSTQLYGIAKVFSLFAKTSPIKVHVFRKAADGLQWLNNPAEPARKAVV